MKYTISNTPEDLFRENQVRLTIDVQFDTAIELIKQAKEIEKVDIGKIVERIDATARRVAANPYAFNR
ncbi:hypothetical protein SEA_NEDARYA_44 [Gordonia phage Nedarya]|nr:hypothetical protein SEA_NEDARYA_44 [Gordonia phage Nedarya]